MKKDIIRTVLGVTLGAILGYAYYHFIGCRSGACPITGNPYISTAYGAGIGLLMTFTKSKKKTETE